MATQNSKQDELNVEEVMSQSEAFILKYKKPISIALIALVVIIVGVAGYNNYYVAPREVRASEALYPGEQYFEAEQYELALMGDSVAYPGFLALSETYSGTKAGNLAQAYAGICYAKMGEYTQAIPLLSSYKGNDCMIAPAVMGTLGNCYAQNGDLEKAATTLIKAASLADAHSLSPIYLIQAGEIYEHIGENAKAVEVYQEVKDKYFNSIQAMEIDKYIERASK